MADEMFLEVVEAVHSSQYARARDLLTRLLRQDQDNAEYWFWMSAVVESSKEKIYCLQNVLRLQPDNLSAINALRFFGANNPDLPAPTSIYRERNWRAALASAQEDSTNQRVSHPMWRIVAILGVIVILGGLIFAGVYGSRQRERQLAAVRPTQIQGPLPTFTPTPTYINNPLVTPRIAPSATFTGPTPLWMLLDATYTPTPLYVNTPHPVIEAFRIAMREFSRENWEGALSSFVEASQVDPLAADIQYYIGESHRFLQHYQDALDAYNKALALDENFAPAYLGRALVTPKLDLDAQPLEDIDKAILIDPGLAAAYLARMTVSMNNQDYDQARIDIEAASQLMPDSALIAIYTSELKLLEGDRGEALKQARLALDRDKTILQAYITLARASLANARYAEALKAVQVFLDFEQLSTDALTLRGQALAGISSVDAVVYGEADKWSGQDLNDAIEAFAQAEEYGASALDLYLLRAIVSLTEKDGQAAVNALVSARKLEPRSFQINLALGRALLLAGRDKDALAQINGAEILAATDLEKAAFYYWRASAADALSLSAAAASDWQELIKLEVDGIPVEWLEQARYRLATATPTRVVPTSTRTPTATKMTQQATATLSATETP